MYKNFFLIIFFLFFFKLSYVNSFEVEWKVDGLSKPESVVYDEVTDFLYVSNINGKALALDGNGYISKISTSGKVIEKEWVSGLDGPKGLAIHNKFLYVADINKIWKISLKNKSKKVFKVNNAGFLNDLINDKSGRVFASDMFENRIYLLDKGKVTEWKKLLFSPNGLLIDENNLVIAQWGKTTKDFKTIRSGYLIKVDIRTKELKRFFSTRPIGNLDGIVFDKNGGYLVTDWINGKLFKVNKKGIAVLKKDLNKGSADLGIVMHKGLVIIPMMLENRLIAYKYN